MNAFTPVEAAPTRYADAPPDGVAVPPDTLPLLASRRQDGWTAAAQRRFLEAIAEGHGVEAAAHHVGLSASAAYAFRRTAKGAAFALGWRAATLVARETVAETLMVRALHGQTDTYTRADGTTVTRHRHDNRLAMSLLARLDRQVETATDADVKAARLVAQEFDAFLDVVERDEGAARAGLFLARRSGELGEGGDLSPIYALAAADRLVRTGVATAAEVPVADLDPTNRAHWTSEQWSRAEAAGLLALAAPVPDDEDEESAPPSQESQHSRDGAAEDGEMSAPVWWDEEDGAWHTYFPSPPDFDGDEWHDFGHLSYERTLTDEEAELMEGDAWHHDGATRDGLTDRRDAYFAALRGETALTSEEGGSPVIPPVRLE